MRFKGNYWKLDLRRAFCSGRWLLCILAVSFSFFLGTDDLKMEIGVLEMISYAFLGGMMWLSFIPCVFVYGDCLITDQERRFYIPSLLRGEQKSYLCAKFFTCFFSALLTMCIGFLVFCALAKICFPLYVYETTLDGICMGVFGELLRERHYPLYFFLVGFQYGLLAGILSVMAMYVSMWYQKRLLIFTMPVFVYYILEWMTISLDEPFQLTLIFAAPEGNRLGNTFFSFGWSVLVTIAALGILYLLMKRKMRVWLENG